MAVPQQKNILLLRLLFFVRILFVLSIFCAVLCCVLLFIFGKNHAPSNEFQWSGLTATAFVLYFSIPTLIIISIYLKVKKENVWNIIKKEIAYSKILKHESTNIFQSL